MRPPHIEAPVPRPTMGVAKRRAFWHSIPRRQGRHTLLGCGCSSGVEHNLAKVGVEGSNPFARSKISKFHDSVHSGARACLVPRFRNSHALAASLMRTSESKR